MSVATICGCTSVNFAASVPFAKIGQSCDHSCAFQVIAVVIVIVSVTPWFVVVLGPLYYIYNYTQGYYIRCSRELKRLESMLKSPTLSHFSESLDGLSTIRAYGAQRQFVSENEVKLDRCVDPETRGLPSFVLALAVIASLM